MPPICTVGLYFAIGLGGMGRVMFNSFKRVSGVDMMISEIVRVKRRD